MKSITLKSPAKVNLDLRILGKYKDGYHKLFTLFHRLSLHDQLKLTKISNDLQIICSHPKVPTGEENLIAKAYRELQKKVPSLGGVRVDLEKNIPVQAGLGGGSSNAAIFLLGMRKLYNIKLPEQAWLQMARKLGADVAFFMRNEKQALGQGRGEKLQSWPMKGRLWFALVPSSKGLSTKEIYQNFRLKKSQHSLTKLGGVIRIASSLLEKKAIDVAKGYLVNDLETSAFAVRPSLKRKLKQLERLGAPMVRLSGSGPTLFAVFGSQKEAKQFGRRFEKKTRQKVLLCSSK